MHNKLLTSSFFVITVALVVAALAGICFVRLTYTDYLSEVQADKVEPLLTFFQDYYLSHNGWDDIGAVDIQRAYSGRAFPEIIHDDMALMNLDGEIVLAPNMAQQGIKLKRDLWDLAVPIPVKGVIVGYLFSGSTIDYLLTSQDSHFISGSIKAIVGAMLIGLIVGYLLSVISIRSTMKPVWTTMAAVKQISQGDLSLRVPLKPYRDMAKVNQAVNDMAASLERNQEMQRLMMMDITHDLRTPLSVQRASIEAIEDGIYPFDQATIALLKDQNQQLIRLVEDLRLLALTESGRLEINKVPVVLDEFIENLLTHFSSVFAKKAIQYKFDSMESDCVVDIDPHLLTRVVENLLQNAYQHSPENSVIEVRINKHADHIVVTIRDQGPGIPPEKLETIFERYYRVKPVENGGAEGIGLGLSISKRIVEWHCGNLYAQNSEEGGAVFVIELPFPGRVPPGQS